MVGIFSEVSMLVARAHIENNNFKSIKIFILESLTGAVLQTHTIDKKPSEESLQEAYDWVNSKYLNIDITIRGFDGSVQKNIISTTGKVRKNTLSINENFSSTIKTFEDFIASSQNFQGVGPDTSPTILRSALREYDKFLKDSGLSNIIVDGAPPDTECLDTTTATLEDDIGDSIAELDDDKYPTKRKKSALRKAAEFAARRYEAGTLNAQDLADDATMHVEQFGRHVLNDAFDKAYKEAAKNVPPSVRKAIELEGLPEPVRKKILAETDGLGPKNYARGVLGDHLIEAVPKLTTFKGDKILANNNNSSILLTRDRNGGVASGYGGKGHTQAAAIDIVVGRMSPNPRTVDENGDPIEVSPMFVPTDTSFGSCIDAARIYISQKSDIDDYFNLADGTVGSSEARSAVALKADSVRLIGTEGVKIVTKTDRTNSQGGRTKKIRGVDIIANNDDSKLQPMVLGDNAQECINELANIVSELVGQQQAMINNMAQVNYQLATHFHPSPFYGAPTLPSPSLAPQAIAALVELVSVESFSTAAAKWNLNSFRFKYLRQGSKKSIRSSYNNVN